LNKLRFDSLDATVKMDSTDLKNFMARIDSMISGESMTASMRQQLEDYNDFRKSTGTRLTSLEDAQLTATAKQSGIVFAFSGLRAVFLLAAAIIGPAVAVVVAILKP
jgi:hypothetical protein